jgi:alkylation response protein AidB-like acyl-CoA dehydrogenase
MDFNLNDEQQMLREATARFVREQYGFEARRKLVAGEGWSPQMWSQYAEMGWLALSVPEADGGLGCGFVETAIVAEELGRGLVLEPFVAVAVLGASLLDGGSAPAFAQRRSQLLAGIAEGKVRAVAALNEPGARYDVDHPQTTARRLGDGWQISGTKMVVEAAPVATHFIVSASLEGAVDGLGLFLVDREAVQIDGYALIDGTRAGDVVLNGVTLGADALLVDPGQAQALLDASLDRAALAQVAESLGAMEAVLAITSEYIKTRHQFGQPIGKFQALQHRMAEMFVEVQEMRSILLRGIAHLEASPVERRLAVSAAKVMLGDAARFVGGQGIQLHGGIGVTDEYQVGHYYKRLLVLEKRYGDADWHLERFVAAQRELERLTRQAA